MHFSSATLLFTTVLAASQLGAGASTTKPIQLRGIAKGNIKRSDGTFNRERFLRESETVENKYAMHLRRKRGLGAFGQGGVFGPLAHLGQVGEAFGHGIESIVGNVIHGLELAPQHHRMSTVVRSSTPTNSAKSQASSSSSVKIAAAMPQSPPPKPNATTITTYIRSSPPTLTSIPTSTVGNATSRASSGSSPTAAATSGTIALTDVIDEYGEDLEYFGHVGFGTPLQDLTINFDTGSADLWAPIVKRKNASNFDTAASSTYNVTNVTFSLTYGSGYVSGRVATDTVSVSGFQVVNQQFGAVDTLAPSFDDEVVSGIMGMGFPTLAHAGTPFFNNLMLHGALAKNLFTFYLTRNETEGSVLSFGSIPTEHYSGDISYAPVVLEGYWQISLAQTFVDGVNVSTPLGIAIDTGTTLNYVPKAVAKMIYEAIPDAVLDATDNEGQTAEFWMYPCNSTPQVSFKWDAIETPFTLSNSDFNFGQVESNTSMCVGSIVGQDIYGLDGNLLGIFGDAYLKNVFTVFNYNGTAEGAPAVGFAPVVE
ncbi:acid protease [Meredithblackwellia eburnea MCA 4105]